jgi:cytochrome c-type biogenesis protein CcmE
MLAIKVLLLILHPQLMGIVTTGFLVGNLFVATEVLAKHDENYMPPEVADALEEAKK